MLFYVRNAKLKLLHSPVHSFLSPGPHGPIDSLQESRKLGIRQNATATVRRHEWQVDHLDSKFTAPHYTGRPDGPLGRTSGQLV